MKKTFLLLTGLFLATQCPLMLCAAPDPSPSSGARGAQPAALEYKMLSGYKQPFNDDLQLHLSTGWQPVGGVSVTTWNNDLFFAQLISKAAAGR